MTTKRVINIFLEQGPRRLWFNPKSSAVNSNGGNNIPYSIFYSIIILINFLLGLRFPTLVQNFLKIMQTKILNLLSFILKRILNSRLFLREGILVGVGLSVAVILTSHLFYLHLDLWFQNSNIVVFIRVTDPGQPSYFLHLLVLH